MKLFNKCLQFTSLLLVIRLFYLHPSEGLYGLASHLMNLLNERLEQRSSFWYFNSSSSFPNMKTGAMIHSLILFLSLSADEGRIASSSSCNKKKRSEDRMLHSRLKGRKPNRCFKGSLKQSEISLLLVLLLTPVTSSSFKLCWILLHEKNNREDVEEEEQESSVYSEPDEKLYIYRTWHVMLCWKEEGPDSVVTVLSFWSSLLLNDFPPSGRWGEPSGSRVVSYPSSRNHLKQLYLMILLSKFIQSFSSLLLKEWKVSSSRMTWSSSFILKIDLWLVTHDPKHQKWRLALKLLRDVLFSFPALPELLSVMNIHEPYWLNGRMVLSEPDIEFERSNVCWRLYPPIIG